MSASKELITDSQLTSGPSEELTEIPLANRPPNWQMIPASFGLLPSYFRRLDSSYNNAYSQAEALLMEDLDQKGLLGEKRFFLAAQGSDIFDRQVSREKVVDLLVYKESTTETEGHAQVIPSLVFGWKPNDEADLVVFSQIPITQIKLILGQNVQDPRIKFLFNPRKFIQGWVLSQHLSVRKFNDPTQYLEGERLVEAHILLPKGL